MCQRRSIPFFVLLTLSASCFTLNSQTPTVGAQEPDSVGIALGTVFNPQRHTSQPHHGFSAAEFSSTWWKRARQSFRSLWVVDGTESMEPSLAGIKSAIHDMIDDLKRLQRCRRQPTGFRVS